MYGLIFAHVSHLLLNWGNDSFVLVQRPNCGKIDARDQKTAPFALPPLFSVKLLRLLMAVAVLVTMCFESRESANKITSVSFLSHLFGALGGLLTGCIFLEARNKNTWIQVGKIVLLVLVFGICFGVVGYKFYVEVRYNNQICYWNLYETMCQKKCYEGEFNVSGNCTKMSLC